MTTFTLTIFPDSAARTKVERILKLHELADLICRQTSPKKGALPWLKLARFGERRSSRSSLRHDANVLAATGVEADYDGEKEPFGSTIRTAFDPRALPRRLMIRVSLTADELHTLTIAIEREATAAEREGQFGTADHLHMRAAMLRETGRC